MKNILTTAGLAAVAVVGVQTASVAQTVTVDDSKWWQVSASLRGFYDDNYTTAPNDLAQESFGFEVRPGIDVGHQGEQHLIKLSTVYSGRWYEDRDENEWDHTIIADLAAEYRLTENHALRLNNTFTYSDEGLLLDRNGVVTTPLRSENSNFSNLAYARYVGQLTRLFGLEVGYQNSWYDYDQDGVGSYSALLDRTEHLFKGETRWTLTPTMAGILGYWYEDVGFDGDEMITFGGPMSDARDSHSHFIVGGVDYTVSPQCFVSVRGGAQNVTYDNLDGEPDQWNPFADVNTTFEYLEDSYFRVGAKYGRNRTDVVGYDPSAADPEQQITMDQETFTVYGMVAHKLTEKLTARATGQVQFGDFNGGTMDDTSEGLYLVGLSLTYDLNQYLALETGYNYDRLDSDDSQRSYSRNRVFLGVRGQF